MKRTISAITAGLALFLGGAVFVAQAQVPKGAGLAAPARAMQVLAAHTVAYALAQDLTRGSGIEVVRAAPANLPPARWASYFAGRGAQPLAEAAARSEAVIGLRSLWAEDPVYPLARRSNIRIVEIDAARPIDGALPGIALQPDSGIAAYPWLHPVNLGRMADIIAADVERLAPASAQALARNLAGLKQRLVALSAQTEAALLDVPSMTVVSLSPRLGYLVAAFNLEAVPVAVEAGDAASAQTLADLIRREGVAVVLHHEELPAELSEAITRAGATVVVLATAGQEPVAELDANARLLVQALRRR